MGASVTSDGYHMVAPEADGEQAGHAMTRPSSSRPQTD